jgi:multiple sugar transport system substrate-binding protein
MKLQHRLLVGLLSLTILLSGSITSIVTAKTTAITMWVYDEMASSEEKALVKARKQFEAQNPGIKINIQNVPYRGLMDRLITANMSKRMPDVVHINTGGTSELAAIGLLRDLNGFAGKYAAQYLEGSILASKYNGTLYAIPWYADATSLIYNKTAFKKAGLPIPSATKPMTFKEFRITAEKLTSDEQFGFGFRKGRGAAYGWFPFLWANGGEILNKKGTQAVFASPKGIEAFKFMTDLFVDGLVPPGAIAYDRWDDIRNSFLLGRIVMWIGGNWELPHLRASNPNFEWDIAPHPMNGKRSSSLGGGSLAITSGSRNAKEAYKWISFLTSHEQMQTLLDGYQLLPARKDAVKAPTVVSDPQLGVFVKDMLHARSYASQLGETIRTEIGNAFDEVQLGRKSAESALKDAEARVNQLLR